MQIVTENAKPLRYNLVAIRTGGTQADTVLDAGERALVDTSNSMDASGNGVFDAYIEGDGSTPNSALELHYLIPADETPTAGSMKGVTSDGIHKSLSLLERTTNESLSTLNSRFAAVQQTEKPIDFAITDENGRAIVQFAGGHARTKKFDSTTIVDIALARLSNEAIGIVDSVGRVGVVIKGGHIYTGKFASDAIQSIATKLKCDFALQDAAGNTVLLIKDGNIYTGNFASDTIRTVANKLDNDFMLQDAAGNTILLIKGGHIYTGNFASDNVLPTAIGPWQNKRLVILGDSITEQGFYVSVLQQRLGCTVYNRGKSGSYIAHNTNRSDDMAGRVDLPENNALIAHGGGLPANDNVDAFMLYGGTNDWWHGAAGLGTFEAAADVNTFYGALKHVVSVARAKYPRKPIILCTMLPSFASTENGFTDYVVAADGSLRHVTKTKADGEHNKEDYNNAIRNIAMMYGCYLIDLAKGAGLCSYTDEQNALYYGNADGVHPSDGYGATILGAYIANCLQAIVPVDALT